MRRRVFVNLCATAAGAAVAPALTRKMAASAAEDDTLQSEFLLNLMLDTERAHNVGSIGVTRIVVPVSGGTFEGPKLRGTIVSPSGDWIIARSDGSSVLDVRLVLRTDDAQEIYMTWRGINYKSESGSQYARILPVFETGAVKYAWLNNIVTVGVYRPVPGKVAYRVYRIL